MKSKKENRKCLISTTNKNALSLSRILRSILLNIQYLIYEVVTGKEEVTQMQYFINGKYHNVNIESEKAKLSAIIACYDHYKRTSNYNQAIAFLMMKIIDSDYNSTDDINITSETIIAFIDDYISINPSVREKLDTLDSNLPENERFFKAVTCGAEKLDKTILEITKPFIDIFQTGIYKAATNFANYISQSFNAVQIASNISKALASVVPSKEEREEIVAALQKWGNYGWCLINWASIDLYHNAPSSVEEADELSMKYCSEEKISNLIRELKDKVDNKIEFEEAVVSYTNQCYTACSMILFATIDSVIIRLQEYKVSSWRMLPKEYAEKLKSTSDDSFFLRNASYLAMLNAIAIIYDSGKNFTNESPEIIKRNFVDHGMNTRRVTQTDCIKLFLIIDNLFYFIEEYGWSYKSDKYTKKE